MGIINNIEAYITTNTTMSGCTCVYPFLDYGNQGQYGKCDWIPTPELHCYDSVSIKYPDGTVCPISSLSYGSSDVHQCMPAWGITDIHGDRTRMLAPISVCQDCNDLYFMFNEATDARGETVSPQVSFSCSDIRHTDVRLKWLDTRYSTCYVTTLSPWNRMYQKNIQCQTAYAPAGLTVSNEYGYKIPVMPTGWFHAECCSNLQACSPKSAITCGIIDSHGHSLSYRGIPLTHSYVVRNGTCYVMGYCDFGCHVLNPSGFDANAGIPTSTSCVDKFNWEFPILYFGNCYTTSRCLPWGCDWHGFTMTCIEPTLTIAHDYCWQYTNPYADTCDAGVFPALHCILDDYGVCGHCAMFSNNQCIDVIQVCCPPIWKDLQEFTDDAAMSLFGGNGMKLMYLSMPIDDHVDIPFQIQNYTDYNVFIRDCCTQYQSCNRAWLTLRFPLVASGCCYYWTGYTREIYDTLSHDCFNYGNCSCTCICETLAYFDTSDYNNWYYYNCFTGPSGYPGCVDVNPKVFLDKVLECLPSAKLLSGLPTAMTITPGGANQFISACYGQNTAAYMIGGQQCECLVNGCLPPDGNENMWMVGHCGELDINSNSCFYCAANCIRNALAYGCCYCHSSLGCYMNCLSCCNTVGGYLPNTANLSGRSSYSFKSDAIDASPLYGIFISKPTSTGWEICALPEYLVKKLFSQYGVCFDPIGSPNQVHDDFGTYEYDGCTCAYCDCLPGGQRYCYYHSRGPSVSGCSFNLDIRGQTCLLDPQVSNSYLFYPYTCNYGRRLFRVHIGASCCMCYCYPYTIGVRNYIEQSF